MKEYKLTESEEKFAELIWKNEPIGSGDLAKLCVKEMDWKKSTTYTVLKKLCEKGVFQNENAIVSSLIKKDEYNAKQSIRIVEDAFGKGNVKGRIKNVLNYRKPLFWAMAISIITVIIVGTALVANPGGDCSNLISEHLDNDIPIDNPKNQYKIADEEKNVPIPLNKPVEDKVCLGVFTTEHANHESYYLLDDESQNQLLPIIRNLKKIAKPEGTFKGRYYLGIDIVYQGIEWEILSDGYLYRYSSDEDTEFFAVNNELCEKVLEIAAKDLGIAPFNPKLIKNIKSAEFMVAFSHNKEKVYKQKIIDSSALSRIEKLFSEAEIINGGSGCPFAEGIMTLILEDGQQIKIAMATDSCCVYFVNGIYFDYKPAESRDKVDSGIGNDIIFDYFNEIPVATRGKDKSNKKVDSDRDFTDK